MIFLKGSCDIDAICNYLQNKDQLAKECSVETNEHGTIYYTGHSVILNDVANNSLPPKSKFADLDMYNTALFENQYKLIVFSLLAESVIGVYENVKTKQRIVYGESKYDATKDCDKYLSEERYFGFKEITKQDYLDFAKEWKFIGRTPITDVINNFKNIINKLGRDIKICFVLGPTIHDELKEMNQSAVDADAYFEELNAALVNEFKNNNNICFISPNKMLNKHRFGEYFFYGFQSILHYKRYVYFNLAKQLKKVTHSNIKINYKIYYKRKYKYLIKHILHIEK